MSDNNIGRKQRFNELFEDMLTDDEDELLQQQHGSKSNKMNSMVTLQPSKISTSSLNPEHSALPPSYVEATKSAVSINTSATNEKQTFDTSKKGKEMAGVGGNEYWLCPSWRKRTVGQVKDTKPIPDDIPYYPSSIAKSTNEYLQHESFEFGPENILCIQSSWHKSTTILISNDPDTKYPDQVQVQVTSTVSGLFSKKPTIKTEVDKKAHHILKVRGLRGSTVYIKISLPIGLLNTSSSSSPSSSTKFPGLDIKTDHTDVRLYTNISQQSLILPPLKFNFKNGKAILSDITTQYLTGDTTNVRLWAQDIKSEDGLEFSGTMRTIEFIRIHARRASISHKFGGLYLRDSNIGLITCINKAGGIKLDVVHCHTINTHSSVGDTDGHIIFESAINIKVDLGDSMFIATPKYPDQPYLVKARVVDGSIKMKLDAPFKGLLRTSGFDFDTIVQLPHNDDLLNPPNKLKKGCMYRKFSYGEHEDDQLIKLTVIRTTHYQTGYHPK
ncbi:hypothetical protein H4219_004829 [Mycoemilia scoparia]|uniref:Uncharacterized protein n=1 Tax=Mycoemilia scoparia TaxID=417184 RepID=A0A9W7ZQD0_9FUNG|nr:hypothetical protein H4219_004829 [Mycoemilia scoparia]